MKNRSQMKSWLMYQILIAPDVLVKAQYLLVKEQDPKGEGQKEMDYLFGQNSCLARSVTHEKR